MGGFNKYEKGFSATEVLMILVIVAVIGLGGWYVYGHQKKKTSVNTTSSGSTTTPKNNYLSQDKMVSQLSEQLTSEFSYIAAPKVQNASLTTNLFGNDTWWVNVQSPNTALTVDFNSPSTGIWQDLSGPQQATYTKQSQAVVNKIGNTLTANGYKLKAPPIHTQTGGGFVSDSGDASGYYQGDIGNCTLLRWNTLPVHIELHCASAALIKSAVDAASPFISPFASANPSRQLSTVEVQGTSVKQTNANQYAMLSIGSPDSVDTHPSDGANFFVRSKGKSWRYLTFSSLCSDTSKVNDLLKSLNMPDSGNAATITIDDFCASLGP